MALSVSTLVVRAEKPPKIVIYGPGGVGKTTLAAEFPNAVFVQTEDGAGSLQLVSFSDAPLGSYAEVMTCLRSLATEDHAAKTLVIDSVTQLEPLIWAETCRRNGWKSIEAPGFGKGYVEADETWRELLSACSWLRDNKNMTIIMIAHETAQTFADPVNDSYDRYQMRLHKRAEALVREWCDVLGFMNQITSVRKEKGGFNAETTKAVGSGQVALNVAPRPAFTAKNRFNMPAQILINPGQGYGALAPHLPGHRLPASPVAAS